MICTIVCTVLVGCQKDVPDPEVEKEIVIAPMKMISAEQEVTVLSPITDQEFLVQHHIRNKQLYVECYIPGITFTNQDTKLLITIDGKDYKEVNTAAFLIKGLTRGAHRISLVVVERQQQRQDLKQEFVVNIP